MEAYRPTRREVLKAAAFAWAGLIFPGCSPEQPQTPAQPAKPHVSPTSEPLSPEQARLTLHKERHYPTVEGKETPATPYLTLPFREADVKDEYDITEGWIYSKAEQAIHGLVNHNGIDIAVSYGTEVVAPVDGYALSTYQTFWLKDNAGNTKTYQGIPLRFGLGYFVQIYVPSTHRFIQIAHLSDIDPAIPFSVPTANGEDWTPVNHNIKIAELGNHPMVVHVRKGQPIGRVGYSGLAFGYEDYRPGAQRPVHIDPTTQKSWDEPHIHFEDFFRDQNTGQKIANRDPYGIYSAAQYYPTPTRKGTEVKDPLFFVGSNSLPIFAG